MNVLALDTATPSTVAAFAGCERRDDPPAGERPRHAARALALIEDVVGGRWDDVERIAVGVGPGGFTGLRIGVATARALAQARGLELVGVCSLAALAHAAGDEGVVLACIDARRGEAFAAAYRGAETLLEPAALGPEALAAAAARLPAGTRALGDGAVRFRTELERAGAAVPADDDPAHRVSALAVAALGARAEPTPLDALLPDYRREPDATAPPRP